MSSVNKSISSSILTQSITSCIPSTGVSQQVIPLSFSVPNPPSISSTLPLVSNNTQQSVTNPLIFQVPSVNPSDNLLNLALSSIVPPSLPPANTGTHIFPLPQSFSIPLIPSVPLTTLSVTSEEIIILNTIQNSPTTFPSVSVSDSLLAPPHKCTCTSLTLKSSDVQGVKGDRCITSSGFLMTSTKDTILRGNFSIVNDNNSPGDSHQFCKLIIDVPKMVQGNNATHSLQYIPDTSPPSSSSDSAVDYS